jgi:S-adenosylmethionine/arginine decarboxylase-like enzyme
MEWLLKNLSLDMHQCNPEKLKDKEFTLQTVRDLTDELDMKPCLEPTVQESYIGLTSGIGLMTSHAVLNNFPTGRLSCAVISSCKDFNPGDVTDWLLRKFEGKRYETILTQYDIPKGPHRELYHKTERMSPLRKKSIRTFDDIKIDDIPVYQSADYELPLLSVLGKDGEKVFLEWFKEKAKGVKVSRRVYQFQPMGETGVFQYSGFADFHHTWPEYGFIMNHNRIFWTPTLLDIFSYAYHGPNSRGISAVAYGVGDKAFAYQNLPEDRKKGDKGRKS